MYQMRHSRAGLMASVVWGVLQRNCSGSHLGNVMLFPVVFKGFAWMALKRTQWEHLCMDLSNRVSLS